MPAAALTHFWGTRRFLSKRVRFKTERLKRLKTIPAGDMEFMPPFFSRCRVLSLVDTWFVETDLCLGDTYSAPPFHG